MGSNIDLRKYESVESVQDAFSRIVSGGKPGYKAVIERKKVPPKCAQCGRGGDPDQKFCNQCGGKMVTPMTHCPGCKKSIIEGDKFCIDCGHSLVQAA